MPGPGLALLVTHALYVPPLDKGQGGPRIWGGAAFVGGGSGATAGQNEGGSGKERQGKARGFQQTFPAALVSELGLVISQAGRPDQGFPAELDVITDIFCVLALQYSLHEPLQLLDL